jgi:c-di-GMP-binding flagellar brake protein YcgR
MSDEKRRSVRHPFIASAEVEELAVGSRLPSRVSDLSAGGCYVDTVNPFPGGTRVRVKIFTATQQFEAPATVVYAHTHMGMGLHFGELAPEHQATLRQWLPSDESGMQHAKA